MNCKFCGSPVHTEKYISIKESDITCGKCTAYCMKQCPLGRSGKTQGWHFEPCLSCDKNPHKKWGNEYD